MFLGLIFKCLLVIILNTKDEYQHFIVLKLLDFDTFLIDVLINQLRIILG